MTGRELQASHETITDSVHWIIIRGSDGKVEFYVGAELMAVAPPSIGVVLPVWDDYTDDRLHDAVRSLRQQDAAAEIILVDNASRIGIPLLPGTRLVGSARRLTLGASRNLGLAAVTSPYVMFWDADDVMLPGTLAHLLSLLDGDERAVAAASALQHPPSGKRYPFPPRWAYRLARRPRLFALFNTIRPLCPGAGSVLMRTDQVRACGGYDDADHGEDWALMSALLFRGPILLTSHLGRAYLAHPTSLSSVHRSLSAVWARRGRVRRRLRSDPQVPAGWKRCMPLVVALQAADVLIFRIVRQLGQRITVPVTADVVAKPTNFQEFDSFAEEYHLLHEMAGDPFDRWLDGILPIGGKRALDVGCGTGRHAVLLADRFSLVDAVDISEPMIRIASECRSRPNIRYRHGDVSTLLDDAKYDLILSVFAMHHVDDLTATLGRIRQLITPGGLVVLVDGVWEGAPPSRRSLYVAELRGLVPALVRRGPRAALTIFRLRTGSWLEHRASDEFLTRPGFERTYGAIFPGALFRAAPQGYAIVWRAPRAR